MAGPSQKSFPLTNAAHNNTFPLDLATTDAKIPELRAIENLTGSAVTVSVKSRGGAEFTVVIQPYQLRDWMYIAAVSGVADGQLVGHV
jgi:hypothetical protein